jgi:hypothetical protein
MLQLIEQDIAADGIFSDPDVGAFIAEAGLDGGVSLGGRSAGAFRLPVAASSILSGANCGMIALKGERSRRVEFSHATYRQAFCQPPPLKRISGPENPSTFAFENWYMGVRGFLTSMSVSSILRSSRIAAHGRRYGEAR